MLTLTKTKFNFEESESTWYFLEMKVITYDFSEVDSKLDEELKLHVI